MIASKRQALIFDLDGVIIDTEALHDEAKRITFGHYNLPVPEALYAAFRGRSDRDMIEHVVRTFGPSVISVSAVLAYKDDVFRSIETRVTPIEGALDFIRLARRHFPKLAVATSATKRNQQFAFEKFALQPYFDVVVTAEEISRTKPHPEVYLKTAELLELDPETCMVIEDSMNGISSAKDAGCVVAAIATSFSMGELAHARADYIVETFLELAMLLGLDDGRAKALRH